MSELPAKRSETVFEDYKEPYTAAQAALEANRCLYCNDPPCVKACPTSIDIPTFIRKIATENVRGSAKTIFESNVLGMSCARVCPVEVLCVGDCVYNELEVPPIQIGKLQRFATDAAFEAKWKFFEAGKSTGKKVALVGGGPASLACAHELRRLGHACTIFEKGSVLGGLDTTGVAPYKMRADRAIEEAAWVLAIGGIEIRSNVNVSAGVPPQAADTIVSGPHSRTTPADGKDVTFEQLEKDYDAVFLGLGLGADSRLGVPGEDLPGIHGAVAFIEKMKLGHVELDAVSSAVVVGGGNTAIDAVRELIGLGIPNVTMVYRGLREKMSGYEHENEAAMLEGAQYLWATQPIGFEGRDRVERVRVVLLDDQRKPVRGSEHTIEAGLVLLAIGQAKLGDLVGHLAGVKLDKGRIVTDDDGFTGRAKYWSGGDCANGGKEVVNAAAEGKRAARAIDRTLGGNGNGASRG